MRRHIGRKGGLRRTLRTGRQKEGAKLCTRPRYQKRTTGQRDNFTGGAADFQYRSGEDVRPFGGARHGTIRPLWGSEYYFATLNSLTFITSPCVTSGEVSLSISLIELPNTFYSKRATSRQVAENDVAFPEVEGTYSSNKFDFPQIELIINNT